MARCTGNSRELMEIRTIESTDQTDTSQSIAESTVNADDFFLRSEAKVTRHGLFCDHFFGQVETTLSRFSESTSLPLGVNHRVQTNYSPLRIQLGPK